MAKLYEKCPTCAGTGTMKGGGTCVSCLSEGYVETGLTVAQVERLVMEERRRRGDPAVAIAREKARDGGEPVAGG